MGSRMVRRDGGRLGTGRSTWQGQPREPQKLCSVSRRTRERRALPLGLMRRLETIPLLGKVITNMEKV